MFSKLAGNEAAAKSGEGAGDKSGDDAALDKVLPTSGSKIEFIVLIMLCMDQMRRPMVDTFDPTITSTPSPAPAAPSPWANPQDADDKPPSYGKATEELGHEDYLRRKRELSSREVQELEKAMLQAFSKWRVQVLKRLGQVLKVKPEDANNKKAEMVAMAGEDNLIDTDQDPDLDAKKDGESDKFVRHHSVRTPLATFAEDDRILLINSLLLLLLSLEHYSSYSRVLLLWVSASLKISSSVVNEKEDAVAHGLLLGAQQQMSAEEAKKRDNNKNATAKAWKMGLATVAGAAVIGITGGLAAPLLAGAVGGVLGGIGLGGTAIAGLLGGLAGNIVLVGGLFGAYGGSMTGKMMEKYAKEVEDFEFIPLRRVDDDKHRLRVAIGVTGWLSDRKEVYLPWLVLGDQIEGFVLQWEVEVLKTLGSSLFSTFKELAVKYAAIEIIKRTIFAGLMIALWPLGLLRIGKALSNSFSVAQARADRAGQVLADALIHKAQGERPVTLIGYSLGARVIYSCLQTLAKRRAFGLIESVILLGTPASAESINWRPVRAVVADRIVNVYSRNDYILGLVYRTSSITPDVAGLQAVSEVAGVENIDVSDLVNGHLRYRYAVGQILDRIGYDALDHVQVDKQKDAAAELDALEEDLRKQAQANKGKQDEDDTFETDLDDILKNQGDDSTAMDNKEIERRLRDLKLREEQNSKKAQDLSNEGPPEVLFDAAPTKPEDDGHDDNDSHDGHGGHRITMLDNGH